MSKKHGDAARIYYDRKTAERERTLERRAGRARKLAGLQ